MFAFHVHFSEQYYQWYGTRPVRQRCRISKDQLLFECTGIALATRWSVAVNFLTRYVRVLLNRFPTIPLQALHNA
jgi:hypothetical protein